MERPVRQFAPDADDENRSALLRDPVLPLAWVQIGPAFQQFLAVHERDFLGQHRLDMQILLTNHRFGLAQDRVDLSHGLLEKVQTSFAFSDDPLPVPLVDIDRMQVVQTLLIRSNGVHIGVQSLPRGESVVGQDHPLPLGQREEALSLAAGVILDSKRRLGLDAVEIVVNPGAPLEKQRRRDPL